MANVKRILDLQKNQMEFRKELGFRQRVLCIVVLSWALLVYGAFLFAFIKEGDWSLRSGDLLSFVALGFVGIWSFRALLRKERLIINRFHKTVIYIDGFIWNERHKKLDLLEFDCIYLIKEYSLVKGEHKPNYIVLLGGDSESFSEDQSDSESFSLDQCDSFEEARSLAVEVANFIGVEVVDLSLGTETGEVGGTLTGSLAEHPAKIRKYVEETTKPDDLRASYQEDGDTLKITVPKAGITGRDWLPILVFYAMSLFCLWLGIHLFLGSFPDGELVSVIFIALVIILWVVATTTLEIFRFFRSAFQSVRVSISPTGLEICTRYLFRSAVISLSLEDLIDIHVIESNLPIWRWLLAVIPDKSQLVIRSEAGIVCFGSGLTIAELRWIRAEICRKLLR